MKIPNSIELQIEEIRNDEYSGANELATKAINTIQHQLDQIQNTNLNLKNLIFILADKIINTRPSMAPLINSIGYILTKTYDYHKASLEKTIDKYFKYQNYKQSQLEEIFSNFIRDLGQSELKIMSLSYSSSILQMMQKLEDFDFQFYILESRPLLEGQKFAKKLAEKYRTHLIVDAAAGFFIDEIDFVLVGADSILKNGSVINKIGTYPLAVLAKSKNKGVYVISDSFKYNLYSHYDLKVKIETKSIKEIYNGASMNKNLICHNYYFDITPSSYIKGIISELGVLTPEQFVEKVNEVLPMKWLKDFI